MTDRVRPPDLVPRDPSLSIDVTVVNAGAHAAAPAHAPHENFPERAWIILEQNWEHNDEFYVPNGEEAHGELYYVESEATAECLRLMEEFFATEPPGDYLDEMECFLEPDTFDPEEVTWDQLRAAGYRGPYRVHALHTPVRKPST